LNETKNVGDAVASARLFNEVQDEFVACSRLMIPQNKSKNEIWASERHEEFYGPPGQDLQTLTWWKTIIAWKGRQTATDAPIDANGATVKPKQQQPSLWLAQKQPVV
jgi:hypothetical protein